ncbi:MAG: 1-acyl-sn-glycerol-3-phosphate acyltransferase [Lachnospiraceae bacterium]|nr:1-acyl-sn-glycerol-3-phosphate acyltransferase [Lachnospiraceae bacterium]
MDDFERFDMSLPPRRTKWYLRPITILISLPDVIKHRAKITKTGMEGIKPPYILLCNHNAFLDFKVATKAIWPARANYVVAIDGFIGREKLLRDVGCICKRKFTNDMTLVKHLKTTIKHGDIAIIYPEARYSLCGTTAVLPESLGKLCKLFGVPVVTFMCHGHHVNSPFWNLHDRNVKPTEAELSLLFTPEDLKSLSVNEINEKLVERFQYDDYKWLKDRKIRIKYKKRAEGLHKVLYQCPECKTEFRMDSEGTKLICRACGKTWTLSEYDELQADEGETYFSHIPDWYEWERANVRAEVEKGEYSTGELEVHVNSLPNAKRYIPIGTGTMVHDMNGFRVKVTDTDGTVREMVKSVPSLYSCHIEYEYLGKNGDCVDLNTLEDTWYVYPHGKDFAVTKMALATEELYNAHRAGKIAGTKAQK